MGWLVPPQPHRVFQRNPLVAVVVELRFFPILRVPDQIAYFQESVRSTFPGFREGLSPLSAPDVREERVFNMLKPDESAALTLSTSALVLEARRHKQRENFIADARVGIDALVQVYGPIAPTRLGLRYVNVIDKEQIEKDLGRTTTWPSLISEPFASVPASLADLDGTAFLSEVSSPMPTGAQTVRYGLLPDVDGRLKYRLDVDRYAEAAVNTGDLVELLQLFADDIFSMFVATMGPDLMAWMPETQL
jgi:uncharacterized protein (TIGR04255 family)